MCRPTAAASRLHGNPQNGSVADEGYVPFTTPELVDAAHAAGMDVVPWTVDDRPTMERLVDIGVDGLITDRPGLLREVLAERGFRLPWPYEPRGPGSAEPGCPEPRCAAAPDTTAATSSPGPGSGSLPTPRPRAAGGAGQLVSSPPSTGSVVPVT